MYTFLRLVQPVNELGPSEVDIIIQLSVFHREDPEKYMELFGVDLSKPDDFHHMCGRWNFRKDAQGR